MPMEPDADDDVLLRMRTAKGNVDHVYYVEDKAEVEMTKARSDELFDYYEYEITVGTDQVLYHFKVVSEQDVCLYNRLGPTQDGQPCFDFKITPGFHTPEWAKGAVMYQILWTVSAMEMRAMMWNHMSMSTSAVRFRRSRNGTGTRPPWMWATFTEGICREYGISWTTSRGWEWRPYT